MGLARDIVQFSIYLVLTMPHFYAEIQLPILEDDSRSSIGTNKLPLSM